MATHGSQIAPFRLARHQRAQHASFLQLNWVFDTLFVHPDVAEDLVKAGVTGVAFGPALDGRTSSESSGRVQLLIRAIIACAETSRLRSVTCRPDNEESRTVITAGTRNYPPETPLLRTDEILPAHCWPPTWARLAARRIYSRLPSGPVPADGRFVELVRKRGWRGLEFRELESITE